jgi:hypothetical protein
MVAKTGIPLRALADTSTLGGHSPDRVHVSRTHQPEFFAHADR